MFVPLPRRALSVLHNRSFQACGNAWPPIGPAALQPSAEERRRPLFIAFFLAPGAVEKVFFFTHPIRDALEGEKNK